MSNWEKTMKEWDDSVPDGIKYLSAEKQVLMRRVRELESENARLKDAQRWIPVSERLPVDKKHYMTIVMNCFDGSRDVYRLRYYGEGDWFSWTSESNVVTHWKEEPELPEVTE